MWPPGFWPGDGGVEAGPAGTCVLYTDLINGTGAPLVGVDGWIIIDSLPEEVGGPWIAGGAYKATSDDDGRITWPPIVQGAKVFIRINAIGRLDMLTVPDEDTHQI